MPGSGALVRWLLANDLVDQFDLLIYPVVVGQGTRLFPDSGPGTALDLVNSRTTSRGITIQTYRPLGRPEYATSTADPNTSPSSADLTSRRAPARGELRRLRDREGLAAAEPGGQASRGRVEAAVRGSFLLRVQIRELWSGARDLNPGLTVPNSDHAVSSGIPAGPHLSSLLEIAAPSCPSVPHRVLLVPGMRDPAVIRRRHRAGPSASDPEGRKCIEPAQSWTALEATVRTVLRRLPLALIMEALNCPAPPHYPIRRSRLPFSRVLELLRAHRIDRYSSSGGW